MNRIDTMYIPTGFPDPIEIDPTDEEQLTVGVE
jgi:Ankyrin repeat